MLVEVLHRAGKKTESQAEFSKLRPLAAYADLDVGRLQATGADRRRIRLAGRLARFARAGGRRRTTSRSGQPGTISLAADAGDQLDGRRAPMASPSRSNSIAASRS